MRSRRLLPYSSGFLAGFFALIALLCEPGGAQAAADDPATIEKITKLNKKGVDEYQNLNFEEARRLLNEALSACADNGLENHPVAARTRVHLGVVLFAGFKQKDAALKEFRKALSIQPDIKLNKSLATPEIQEVYDEAVAAQSEDAARAKAPRAPGEGIDHTAIGRSPQGQPISIKATVDPSLGAKKIVLYFKADGADDFAEKEMSEDPPGSGTWVGEIPASATQGALVDYTIEAVGDDPENPISTKGTNDRPIRIVMLGPNGQPLLTGKPKKPPKPPSEDDVVGASYFLGLGVGTGFGWASGKGEINPQSMVDPAGFAPSSLGHVVPELGLYLSPELLLSLQLRFQYITGATAYHATEPGDCGDDMICEPGNYALAAFGRATYFLAEGDFRPYVVGTLGGGRIRHVAKFNSLKECGPEHDLVCIDTVPSGPIYAGGGGGFLYNLTNELALNLGVNALLGFTRFTFHVDINAGVAYSF